MTDFYDFFDFQMVYFYLENKPGFYLISPEHG